MSIQTKSIRRTLDDLIRRVWEENLRLKASGLVTMTWGNVSGIDRRRGIVVIKPSGLDYAALRPADMVLTDLDGRRLEPASRLESARMPSTDLPTLSYTQTSTESPTATLTLTFSETPTQSSSETSTESPTTTLTLTPSETLTLSSTQTPTESSPI